MGRKEQFSYEGKRALYDFLIELEDDIGKEQELDVIALCCEFTEYDNLKELQENYNVESIEDLEDKTCVIPVDPDYKDGYGRFIIQDY